MSQYETTIEDQNRTHVLDEPVAKVFNLYKIYGMTMNINRTIKIVIKMYIQALTNMIELLTATFQVKNQLATY